jgi:transposase
MRDTEFYQRVLGLEEPWTVTRVELNVSEQQVDIWVGHPAGVKWLCPHCGEESDELSCRDHAEERTWRHLDTCQFKTYLHARIPRVDCPEHGVVNVSIPWAEAQGRFTALMEAWIIEVLHECATVTGACYLTDLSWDEVFGVMQRAVARGQARKKKRPLPHIGVDEKAFRRGHSYMTVVCDLDRSTVEYVSEGRSTESLAEYYQTQSGASLAAVEAVAMDMWEPYVQATLEHVPLAAEKIVFDRFHIMKHMNEAMDKVRGEEHRALTAQHDDTLTGTKHWWLYAEENLPDQYQEAFARVRDQNLRTSRAWAIKETLRELWFYRSVGWARKFFRKWYDWAARSKLEPVREVAAMLRRRLEQVLNYCKYEITNAVAEGLNSKIMAIKRRACGYRNKENLKTAIYFFCGGLDLCPR